MDTKLWKFDTKAFFYSDEMEWGGDVLCRSTERCGGWGYNKWQKVVTAKQFKLYI